MAGHSKWANIKHRKAGQDAKRGKIFTKLIKEITVAARLGGGDVDSNPRLRLALDKAFSANMTKDTVSRAIKRGAGDGDATQMDEITYEGRGTAGTAVMVECLTDNKNRTVADVRHAFTKFGGSLGTDGSVAYLFTRAGSIAFAPGADEDTIMEAAIEAGADDVITHDDGSIEVKTPPYDMVSIKEALIAAGLTPDHADVSMDASTEVELTADQTEKFMKMIDMLEDHDDVQNVYSNAVFPDE